MTGYSLTNPIPISLIDRITFPDGTYYSFTYEDSLLCSGAKSGRLKSITLPTGGTITYGYPSDAPPVGPYAYSGTWFDSLTRTDPDGTTTYQRNDIIPWSASSPISAWTTKITKPSGSSIGADETDIDFISGPASRALETGRRVYQGTSGTPLLSTTRCYNGNASPCTTTAFAVPILETDETRSLNGNAPTRKTVFYNTAHLVTEVDEYDFGGSTVLRKTLTSYASLGNNIQDRPSSMVVKDGSGATVKQTNFYYDQSSLATPDGTTPNLVSVSGARGNLTQKDEWTGSGYNSTHYTYDTAGQLVSEKDPLGNVTSYLYDDGTDTIVKQITRPVTGGGVQHVTRYEVNPYTLRPDAKTDENSIITEYVYDSMLRLTATKSAVGDAEESWYTVSYPSATQIISSQDKTTKNDQAISSSVFADSYGRTQQSVDAAGNMVDSNYDVRGRLLSVSNPHGASGSSTDGTTSYQYDALDRKITQTNPDSTTVTWNYLGNTTTTTDESGRETKRVTDALGRLTDVYEDPIGLNLHTQYTYDILGSLSTVTQNGTGGESPRTRSFTYDSLSRLITATNSETGTICYGQLSGSSCANGYDANGNLLYKTDARGITTTYSYDALNRPHFKTYSDGTLPAGFGYDGFDEQGNPISSSNPIGRLTRISNVTNAFSGYSYDAMGTDKCTI